MGLPAPTSTPAPPSAHGSALHHAGHEQHEEAAPHVHFVPGPVSEHEHGHGHGTTLHLPILTSSKRDSFEGVHVDELEGATGHDPHRGRRHNFEGVHVDELQGATGHDPHRGKQHGFGGVHVDELEGATGHDSQQGKQHDFGGVHVDELEGATGHNPHRGRRHSFDGVHVDELEGGSGHTLPHSPVSPGLKGAQSIAPSPQPSAVGAAAEGSRARARARKGAAPSRLGAQGDPEQKVSFLAVLYFLSLVWKVTILQGSSWRGMGLQMRIPLS